MCVRCGATLTTISITILTTNNMANYATLKAAIESVVKTNGNNEITGALLQQTLLSIIDSVGFGYQFIGVATPGTNPGTPDQRVFYLASAGTYPNFGPAVIPSGSLGVFYYNTEWHVDSVAFPIGDGSITQSKIESSFLQKLLAGYVYMGVAAANGTPVATDRDCFYITTTAGTYTRFGNITVDDDEIAILKYSATNSQWSKDSLTLSGLVQVVIDALTEGGTGYIFESDYPKTGVIEHNGVWRSVAQTNSILIPLQTGTTYTLTFANGLGGYSIVLDSQAVAGATIHYAPGYSGQIATTQGQVVTIQGVTGQYLYVRADPTSTGRVFPIIVTQSAEPMVVLRSEVEETPTEGSTGVVTSGGLYNIFAAINALLAEIKDVLPTGQSYPPGRQDVPVSSVSFYRRTPDGSSATTRVLSSTITIPNGATGFHIKCASGFMVIAYYLRENGTWDASVQSSGAFAQNADLGAPNYTSGGIWVYFRKDNASATITVQEVQAAITEMYFDVPDSFYLPVASKELAQKSISILFIGNSLTQDAVSYVPYLLRNLYPNVAFKFYIWYNGGYTLAQQYTKFVNNQTCEIFSICENNINWQNLNNAVTMSNILSTYQFDIVCLQEYFNYKTTYTETDLADFNNCLAYIRANYNRNFKVVTLFHAPLRSSADAVFERTKAGNELILKKTIAESMMAPGVAIYRALSTTLDSLGDLGHLSPDGTHAQEGLPCLLEAFVVFIWIMRQLAIPISIANCQLRMTTTVYNSINVPGPNLGTGVIPGTDAENNLAQDVAILADKEGCGMLFESFICIGQ